MNKKHIIYLAAGNSVRFAGNKLLYRYNDKPLYRHGLDKLRQLVSGRNDCTLQVVTQYPEIEEYCRTNSVKVKPNPDSKLGASYSIKAGIRMIDGLSEDDYLIFVVADQPNLSIDTVKKLIELTETRPETARVSCGGVPGNPVIFSVKLVDELMTLSGDEGGKKILKSHQCLYVEASAEELKDIDLIEDIK